MMVNSRDSEWCWNRSIMLSHTAIAQNKNSASRVHSISRRATELGHSCFERVSPAVDSKKRRNGYSAKLRIGHGIQRRYRLLVQHWLSDVYLLRVIDSLVQQIALR